MTHFFTSSLWRSALALSIVLILTPRLFSQCNPDLTPPIAICNPSLTVVINADDPNDCYGPAGPNNVPAALQGGAVAWIQAAQFNDGSYDECNNILLTVRRQAPYSNIVQGLNQVRGVVPCDDPFPTFPSEFERAISEQDSIKFYCGEAGTAQTVILKVYQVDANGIVMLDGQGQPIATECLVTVQVEEKDKPTLQAPPDVTVSCENFDPTFAAYGTPNVQDNCCIDHVVTTVNYTLFDSICSRGTITRVFQAFDCAGNSSTLGAVSAMQTIVISHEQNYFIKFPDDLILTELDANGFYGNTELFGETCELLGVSYADEYFTNEPDCDVKLERVWSVINWCTYDPNLPTITVPNPEPNATNNNPENLPGVVVSASGTPSPWAPTLVKIHASDPIVTDYSTFWDSNANRYDYKQIIKVIDSSFVTVQGKVFSDSNANCSFDTNETLLEGWTVKATGQVTGTSFEVQTNMNGEYSVSFDGSDTTVVITLIASSNFGQNCQSEYTIHVANGETAVQDVPVHLEQRCGLLSVGLATARLRRCAQDNQYTVQACNLSDALVPNAYVEVTLDDFFDYSTSSIPGTLVSGNTYKFELGDFPSGDCQTFTINFGISCDAQLSATHCTEARVFPYDDCRGNNSNWSGAEVSVTAVCDGDSVRLAITNIGDGNMSQSLDFVVVEDVVMRQSGPFQLNLGETFHITQPANGSTWRLEAEQEPLHPWGGPEAVALEGCGGINNAGLVNLFPLNDPNPFQSVDCHQNIGSFDPNDLQGFPIGYGNQHFIKANTDIEYLIRFQNTGTDTAFNVVVVDQLAAQFDPATVRVEVASHPVAFSLLEGGLLRFSFENILLPDSNINLSASNGFVKFRVSQKPDLAEGTKIENQAAIYFDGNDPILTNTTFHTIGDHFISVSTDDLENDGLLRAYPNPASEVVFFDLKELANTGRFELSNNLGQQVSAVQFSGSQYRFERKNLPAGIYHFQIIANNTKIATGKIVLK